MIAAITTGSCEIFTAFLAWPQPETDACSGLTDREHSTGNIALMGQGCTFQLLKPGIASLSRCMGSQVSDFLQRVKSRRFPTIEKDMKMVLAHCGSLFLDPASLMQVGLTVGVTSICRGRDVPFQQFSVQGFRDDIWQTLLRNATCPC